MGSNQCRHCWRVGAERDGCGCVLELTTPTHPEHAARQEAAGREALVARIREVIRAELVVQFDGGGWLKVDEFHSSWIELDGTVDVQQLAEAVVARLFEGA